MALTLSLIQSASNLDLLSQKFGEDDGFKYVNEGGVDGGEHLNPGSLTLPSWCPDWSLRPRRFELQHHYRRLKDLGVYKASRGLPFWMATIEAEVEKDSPLGPIVLRGFNIDVVSQVGEIRRPSWGGDGCEDKWHNMVLEHQKTFGNTYPTGDSCRDAFWMTLCAGIIFQTPDERPPKKAWDIATPQKRLVFETWAKKNLHTKFGTTLRIGEDPLSKVSEDDFALQMDYIEDGFTISSTMAVEAFQT